MDAVDQTLHHDVLRLYLDHYSWLKGWLGRKLGNGWDADDLAHDAFMRVFASRRPVGQWGEQPRALLTHIAKGLVIDHWRRQALERAYRDALAQLPEAEAPSPEAGVLILEALQRVDATLARLPERTRSIFVLSQIDGLTYQQVADQLGTSLITVKRHMRAAFAACIALDS